MVELNNTIEYFPDNILLPDVLPRHHFYRNFGFVRGSNLKIIREEKPLLSSMDII